MGFRAINLSQGPLAQVSSLALCAPKGPLIPGLAVSPTRTGQEIHDLAVFHCCAKHEKQGTHLKEFSWQVSDQGECLKCSDFGSSAESLA